jgi:hypothetical protein
MDRAGAEGVLMVRAILLLAAAGILVLGHAAPQ